MARPTRSSDRLAETLYTELRELAGHRLAALPPGASLEPTALVHEVYVRLAKDGQHFENRAHYFAAAAQAMRRIVIESARRRRAKKRGGEWRRISLEALSGDRGPDWDLEALDEALDRLEALDPRAARVVLLRAFGGLTVEEAAKVLEMSIRTVHREWQFGRAFLVAQLDPRESDETSE
ncbi:MAG: sigma-70 family RNA polymerase sigma factor [Planctomycetes bacterium]|nr:sigma-70 family RNA polymerase sigma factor [Planctomycetota bacterium]